MKITVTTVCYNSFATIKNTLESVALHRYRDIEHLIVDGGSKNRTLEIFNAWLGHSVRVVSEPDEGIYDATNKGLALLINSWNEWSEGGAQEPGQQAHPLCDGFLQAFCLGLV